MHVCLIASSACVRRARARRTGLTSKANQTKKCIPGSPSQPHRNPCLNEEKHGMLNVFRTAAAAALAQEKPLTRSQTCPPCPPTAKTYSQGAIFEGFEQGCRGCKGCCRNAGVAGEVCEDAEAGSLQGDLHSIYSVFEGRATWHQKPVARPGRPGMFLGPSV